VGGTVTVEECVLAIEECEVVGMSANQCLTSGDYIAERRERMKGSNIVERYLLYNGKQNADDDNGLKSERDKKVDYLMGFDPFDLAIGAAVVFFLWAINGGLQLH